MAVVITIIVLLLFFFNSICAFMRNPVHRCVVYLEISIAWAAPSHLMMDISKRKDFHDQSFLLPTFN